MASVLFTDIVGFSRNTLERQSVLLDQLQKIVRDTKEYQQAEIAGKLLKLPTGDGMALVFFQDPVSPVRCAIEIQTALKAHPELLLRTGVHTGPIYRQSDIKDNINVVGGGINIAQRVMDCGDAGHILVSRAVAEVLEQLDEWPQYLKSLGIFEVKHGVQLEIYNIIRDGAGIAEPPTKLKGQRTGSSKASTPARRWMPLWVGGAAVALVVAGWFALRPAPTIETKKVVDEPQRMLQYYIMVQRYRNNKPYLEPIQLAKEMAFERDYRCTLVVTAAESGYLYIVDEGPQSTPDKPDISGFFPDPRVRDGSAHLDAGQVFSTHPLALDAQQGKEKLWLIWSADSLPDLDVIKHYVNSKDIGVVKDPQQARAIALFLKKYAGGNATLQTDDQNKFTILRGTGKVLVRLIELEHM
jgi:hypothetical protein